MTPSDILAGLRARGVKLWLVEAPEGLLPQLAGTITEADRALLKEHRPALIDLLLAEMRAKAEGLGGPAAADRDVRFFDPAPPDALIGVGRVQALALEGDQ